MRSVECMVGLRCSFITGQRLQSYDPSGKDKTRKILEEKFVEYLNDEVSRFRVMEYAWEKLNEVYTYDLVKKQITDILGELNA